MWGGSTMLGGRRVRYKINVSPLISCKLLQYRLIEKVYEQLIKFYKSLESVLAANTIALTIQQ